jgi:hypothetical protein
MDFGWWKGDSAHFPVMVVVVVVVVVVDRRRRG